MTATKSKPAGRVVMVKPKVRVRKIIEMQDRLVTCIHNPPPGLSCAKLKRLVEIAGMDEEAFIAYSVNHGFNEFGARLAYEALGLSTAQGRKGEK